MQPVLIALVALLGIVGAANLLLTLALARRLAEAERRAGAGQRAEPRMPRVGAEVGTFSVQTAGGARLTDARLRSGRTLLIFSLADCGPCATLAEELRRTELPSGLGLVILLAAPEDERGALTAAAFPAAAELAFVPPDSDLIDRFDVDAFPTLVLVEEGRITAVGREPSEVLAALTAAPA
jgi:hypothetical protein